MLTDHFLVVRDAGTGGHFSYPSNGFSIAWGPHFDPFFRVRICVLFWLVLGFFSRGRGFDGLHDMVTPCSIGSVARAGIHVCDQGWRHAWSKYFTMPTVFFLGERESKFSITF